MKKLLILYVLIFLSSCDSPSENKSATNKDPFFATVTSGSRTFLNIDHNIFHLTGTTANFIIDKYDSTSEYTVKLIGVYLGETVTLPLSFESTSIITDDSSSTRLSVNTTSLDLKSDFYEAQIKESKSGATVDVMSNGETAYLVDQNGSDYFCIIQVENNSFVPQLTLNNVDDFRVRPMPSLVNTSGKLYFYNMSMVIKDSLSSNGASGSVGSDGISRWFSMKFTPTSLTTNSGKYLVRFENGDRSLKSPFLEIDYTKN